MVIPPKPDVEWRETVTEAVPDCDSVTVEVTTVKEAAGYWWNDEAWILGSFQPVSEETTSREATAEECPVPAEEPDEVVEPETPGEAAPDATVDAVEATPVAKAAVPGVLEEEVTEVAEVREPVQLAETGGDATLPIALGLALAAVAVGMIWKGRKA